MKISLGRYTFTHRYAESDFEFLFDGDGDGDDGDECVPARAGLSRWILIVVWLYAVVFSMTVGV